MDHFSRIPGSSYVRDSLARNRQRLKRFRSPSLGALLDSARTTHKGGAGVSVTVLSTNGTECLLVWYKFERWLCLGASRSEALGAIPCYSAASPQKPSDSSGSDGSVSPNSPAGHAGGELSNGLTVASGLSEGFVQCGWSENSKFAFFLMTRVQSSWSLLPLFLCFFLCLFPCFRNLPPSLYLSPSALIFTVLTRPAFQ